MIDTKLLLTFGARIKEYEKNELIFSENDSARYYFQIMSGMIKMNNFNDDGKEFIQGVFYEGQSFGEPPLFVDINYPANAVTLSKCTLLILPKKQLLHLLFEYPEIHLEITKSLAKRLHYKAIIASEISSQEPEHRVLRFIDYLKNDLAVLDTKFTFEVPYTRQQIADILGLRVETVIRAIKSLESKKEVQIRKRKVFR